MQAQPSSVPSPHAPHGSARQEAIGRELCRAHGSALVAIAVLILADPPDVCDVVAETIADASRATAEACRATAGGDDIPTPADEVVDARELRRRLARSVFDRSRGRLVVRERFAQPVPAWTEADRALPAVLQRLDADLRSAVALTMFGAHGLEEAAAVLNLAPETVLGQLRSALAAAHEAVHAMAGRPSDVDDAADRRRPHGLVGARQRFQDGAEADGPEGGPASDHRLRPLRSQPDRSAVPIGDRRVAAGAQRAAAQHESPPASALPGGPTFGGATAPTRDGIGVAEMGVRRRTG